MTTQQTALAFSTQFYAYKAHLPMDLYKFYRQSSVLTHNETTVHGTKFIDILLKKENETRIDTIIYNLSAQEINIPSVQNTSSKRYETNANHENTKNTMSNMHIPHSNQGEDIEPKTDNGPQSGQHLRRSNSNQTSSFVQNANLHYSNQGPSSHDHYLHQYGGPDIASQYEDRNIPFHHGNQYNEHNTAYQRLDTSYSDGSGHIPMHNNGHMLGPSIECILIQVHGIEVRQINYDTTNMQNNVSKLHSNYNDRVRHTQGASHRNNARNSNDIRQSENGMAIEHIAFAETFVLAPQVNGYYILNDIFLHTGVAGPPPLISSNLQSTDQGMDLSPNAGWHSMMPDQIATIPNHPMMNMNDQQYGYYDAYKRPVYDVTPSHMIPSNNGMKPPFQPTPQEFIPHTDHHTHTTQNDAYLNITRPGQPSFPRDKEVTSEPHSAVSTASSKPPVNNSRSRHNPVDTDSISSRPLSPPRKRSASRSKSASHTNAVSTATSTSPLQSANEQVPSPAAPKDNHAAGIANHPTNILSEVKPSKKKDVNVKSIAAIPRSRLEHQSSEIAHNGSDKAQNSLGVNLPQKASPSSTVLAGSSTKTQSPIKESHDSTPVVDNHIPTEPTGSASRMRIKSPRKAIPSGVQTTESITTSVVGESTQTAITAASNNQNDLPEISSNSIPPSKQKEAFTRPTDSQKTEPPSTGPKSWASMASNPTTKWSPSLSAASAITPITVAPVTQGRNQHRGTQERVTFDVCLRNVATAIKTDKIAEVFTINGEKPEIDMHRSKGFCFLRYKQESNAIAASQITRQVDGYTLRTDLSRKNTKQYFDHRRDNRSN